MTYPQLNLFSILLQNSNSKFPPLLFKKKGWRRGWYGLQQYLSCHETGLSILETLPLNRKTIHDTPDIEVSIVLIALNLKIKHCHN